MRRRKPKTKGKTMVKKHQEQLASWAADQGVRESAQHSLGERESKCSMRIMTIKGILSKEGCIKSRRVERRTVAENRTQGPVEWKPITHFLREVKECNEAKTWWDARRPVRQLHKTCLVSTRFSNSWLVPKRSWRCFLILLCSFPYHIC